jgi:pimeloyl-ACP methyl ester carboxylesterase
MARNDPYRPVLRLSVVRYLNRLEPVVMSSATYEQPQTRTQAGLVVDTWGAADGRPPIVLVPGLTYDRITWRPVAAALQRLDPGRQVLAVDLPGHGDSPGVGRTGLGADGRALHRALAAAGVRSPLLVGHSAAAVTATFYGAEYPVRGIVNVDCPVEVAGFAAALRPLAERFDRDYARMWEQVMLPSLRIGQLPEPTQRLLAEHSTPTPEILANGWEELLERPVPELAARVDEALARLRWSGTAYLSVFGDDPGRAYLDWLARRLPQARAEVWPGHTHFPHLADPDRFARLLVGPVGR